MEGGIFGKNQYRTAKNGGWKKSKKSINVENNQMQNVGIDLKI